MVTGNGGAKHTTRKRVLVDAVAFPTITQADGLNVAKVGCQS